MRPIGMHEHAVGVVAIIGIAADMRAAIDQKDPLSRSHRKALCQHRAGKPRPHDYVIEYGGKTKNQNVRKIGSSLI